MAECSMLNVQWGVVMGRQPLECGVKSRCAGTPSPLWLYRPISKRLRLWHKRRLIFGLPPIRQRERYTVPRLRPLAPADPKRRELAAPACRSAGSLAGKAGSKGSALSSPVRLTRQRSALPLTAPPGRAYSITMVSAATNSGIGEFTPPRRGLARRGLTLLTPRPGVG